jgi:aspartyl-tRNA(Asn)/glutamyl-tRNA(Gln) amidotransferase subunit C
MDIDTVARLARIALDGEESARYADELKGVLDLMATLDELDLSGVEPTRHVVHIDTPLRDDIPGEPLSRDLALANAPSDDGESFIVPKVV